MGKLPAFVFYSGDWQKDPALNACDWKARAVWFSLLLVMHEAPKRGCLSLSNDSPMTDKQLANLTRIPLAELTEAMSELESAGVFSRDDNGVIYSRRMLRDEERRQAAKTDGEKGGRPKGSTSDCKSDPVKYVVPTWFPPVEGDRQPFGLERDALETGDILRIEAAFMAAWNAADKVLQVTAIHNSRLRQAFWERVSEPGWLAKAEQALAIKRTDGGSLRLSRFLDGETPQAIIAGNYSFSGTPRKRKQPDDGSAKAIKAAGQKHKTEEQKRQRLTELEAEYRTKVEVNWFADAGTLTAEHRKRLAELFPDLKLAELEQMATSRTSNEMQRRLYGSALCEALEREDGGLSCAAWCEQQAALNA